MSGEAVVQTGSDGDLDVGMEERILRTMGLSDAPQTAPKTAPAETAPVDVAESADTQTEPTESDPEDNLIEIDFKGARYKVPKELKELQESGLRQEDYTRKTQEVAEKQRLMDLREQQAQANQALQQAAQPFLEQLMSINNNIKSYKDVDWGAWTDQDPTQANKHWIAYQSLKDKKVTLEQEMQGAAARHLEKLRESADRLKSENSKILTSKVKGWSAEREQKVRDHAESQYGFSKQELGQVFDARLLRLMNDAYEWQTLQSAKPQLQKQAPPAQKTLKPNATQGDSKAKTEVQQIRRDIRSAKTDSGKAAGIQKFLERTLR